jgi:hypothetical protein
MKWAYFVGLSAFNYQMAQTRLATARLVTHALDQAKFQSTTESKRQKWPTNNTRHTRKRQIITALDSQIATCDGKSDKLRKLPE